MPNSAPVKMDDKWYWNYVPVPSALCDLCVDRIEEGKKPACAHHCLAQCMEAVAVEDLAKRMEELGGEGVACFMP